MDIGTIEAIVALVLVLLTGGAGYATKQSEIKRLLEQVAALNKLIDTILDKQVGENKATKKREWELLNTVMAFKAADLGENFTPIDRTLMQKVRGPIPSQVEELPSVEQAADSAIFDGNLGDDSRVPSK